MMSLKSIATLMCVLLLHPAGTLWAEVDERYLFQTGIINSRVADPNVFIADPGDGSPDSAVVILTGTSNHLTEFSARSPYYLTYDNLVDRVKQIRFHKTDGEKFSRLFRPWTVRIFYNPELGDEHWWMCCSFQVPKEHNGFGQFEAGPDENGGRRMYLFKPMMDLDKTPLGSPLHWQMVETGMRPGDPWTNHVSWGATTFVDHQQNRWGIFYGRHYTDEWQAGYCWAQRMGATPAELIGPRVVLMAPGQHLGTQTMTLDDWDWERPYRSEVRTSNGKGLVEGIVPYWSEGNQKYYYLYSAGPYGPTDFDPKNPDPFILKHCRPGNNYGGYFAWSDTFPGPITKQLNDDGSDLQPFIAPCLDESLGGTHLEAFNTGVPIFYSDHETGELIDIFFQATWSYDKFGQLQDLGIMRYNLYLPRQPLGDDFLYAIEHGGVYP